MGFFLAIERRSFFEEHIKLNEFKKAIQAT